MLAATDDCHPMTADCISKYVAPLFVKLAGIFTLAIALLSIVNTQSLRAEEIIWKYSAYEIQVWLSFDSAAEFTPEFRNQVSEEIVNDCEAFIGGSWNVNVSEPPPELRYDVSRDVESMTVEFIENQTKPDDENPSPYMVGDKIMFAAVSGNEIDYRIDVRELDVRTQTWSPTIRRVTRQREMISGAIYRGMVKAFIPMVRIEDVVETNVEQHDEDRVRLVRKETATCEIRAIGLIQGDKHPGIPAVDTLMRPVVRRNDRFGRPTGIREVPWTMLIVGPRTGDDISCEIRTAYPRSPLGGRSGKRTLRIALAVKMLSSETDLLIRSKGAGKQALPGYEIYEKDLITDKSTLLGETDWRGIMTIGRGNFPLRLLYVKSGGRLLARLPVVPGARPEIESEVFEDQARLEAESVVRGFQSKVMDIVAQRQVLSVQIRSAIKKQDFERAAELLREVQSLDDYGTLNTELGYAEREYVPKDDVRQRSRVEPMFEETRKLLEKFLDNDIYDDLADELRDAQDAA